MAYDPNDPADVAIVEGLVETAVTEATAPLIKKRNELLNEVKTLRAGQGNPATQAEVDRLEAQVETLTTELTATKKDAKTAKLAAEKATKDLEGETAANRQLLVDRGLTDALTEAGVKDTALQKGARALLASSVQIVTEGDQRVAKVGDKPLSDYVKEWAGSDDGKRYVAAPGNGGGGAGGDGGGAGKGKSMARSAFDSLGAAEKATFSKEGGQLTEG